MVDLAPSPIPARTLKPAIFRGCAIDCFTPALGDVGVEGVEDSREGPAAQCGVLLNAAGRSMRRVEQLGSEICLGEEVARGREARCEVRMQVHRVGGDSALLLEPLHQTHQMPDLAF